jgi:hypothetical protein
MVHHARRETEDLPAQWAVIQTTRRDNDTGLRKR